MMRGSFDLKTIQYFGIRFMLIVFPILLSGCASSQAAYPPAAAQPLVYPVVPVNLTPAPRVPDLQDAWNRCTQDDSGDSYCSTSYRKVENYSPNGSIVTEGLYVHNDQKNEPNDTPKTITPKPHAKAHHKAGSHLVASAYPKQNQGGEPKSDTTQVMVTCTSATIPCADTEGNTRQIQNNIQTLRASLREWMRSQGDY